MNRFPSYVHDHDSCIAYALSSAEIVCKRRGVRLTNLRRRVLQLIWDSHAPIRAYDLLEKLSSTSAADCNKRSRFAPQTVYRALEFLIQQGLVHRIESLNAFVGCVEPKQNHMGYFLICQSCGTAQEFANGVVNQVLRYYANDVYFQIKCITIEVSGLCANCLNSTTK
ncbi:transcriptional regulator np20 [Candidatus Endolissoclinum faulkneri L2]|uniref:Transcriptional regulator np20 n=1 Tax=Candidatus Endolissoclinum faulkneri L2 TaxID=1193729 RepID=K7YPY5_9PROT|nr:Fur family transcriptional regulator [Candidatus Endolissoclinum faulkneri]AFX98639.1 transcriptional regulator np20 [Candidatus Endolissoclinum faulkneri L2]